VDLITTQDGGNMHGKSITYENKRVFIGIDVHKKTYSVSSISDGALLASVTMRADKENLVSYLISKYKGADIYSVYEAGFAGFGLHRRLIKEGINNIVIHPAAIGVSSNDRVKTDKRDSKKLAMHLSGGLLSGIFVPSQNQELSRLLCRSRYQYLRSRTRLRNQIRMRLHQFNFIPPEMDQKLTKGFIQSTIGLLPKDLRFDIEQKMETWEFLDNRLGTYNKKILSSGNSSDLDARYLTLPGCGTLTARILATELGDMYHFSNEKALYRFTGLTPSEHSSGTKLRRGKISKQGNPVIRHTLIQLAWRAVGKDSFLAAKYKTLSLRIGRNKAIVAIARKLIGIARSMFINNTTYKAPVKMS